jgi:hypothetical protein
MMVVVSGEIDRDDALRLVVEMGKLAVLVGDEDRFDPKPGDLVVEVTGFLARPDPDAVGWLVGHDDAPYNEDGTGPMREVWDIRPLRGFTTDQERARGYQRWENARFVKLPDRFSHLVTATDEE